jgi:hypothetical protein
MFITTPVNRYRALFATNSTASSITAPAATTTKPTGDGVMDMGVLGSCNAVMFSFFGTATNNQTATALILGWRRVSGLNATDLWVPEKYLLLALTYGALAGVAATPVVASQLFADTIAVTTAFTSAYEVISAADDQMARVKVDHTGAELVEVRPAIGTATSGNALVTLY